MKYVLGFIFNETKDKVLLIKKQKPDWQKDKLNGIGGKIENEESPEGAMIRECLEETGLHIKSWRHYATMVFNEEEVFVFSSLGNIENVIDEGRGESLYQVNVNDILLNKTNIPIMTNVPWLISMNNDTGFKQILTVFYNEKNG